MSKVVKWMVHSGECALEGFPAPPPPAGLLLMEPSEGRFSPVLAHRRGEPLLPLPWRRQLGGHVDNVNHEFAAVDQTRLVGA